MIKEYRKNAKQNSRLYGVRGSLRFPRFRICMKAQVRFVLAR